MDRSTPRGSRLRPLAVCVALAFSAEILAVPAGDHPRVAQGAMTKSGVHPNAPTTWTVKNCNDDGMDSLRDIVRSNHAQSGDIVDLSKLPTMCGMADSTISLSSGEIVMSQDSLTLIGPDTGSVTISGGNASRVLLHQGGGFLKLESLTIANGHYQVAGTAAGGCIESFGSVYSKHVTVTACKAQSDASFAEGGGIYASSDVTLISSTISNCESAAPQGTAYGGGVYTKGGLASYYSTISGNTAKDSQGSGAWGGGAYVRGGAVVLASTIDNNSASYGSALLVEGGGAILNSTISDNTSNTCCAVDAFGSYLTIANSTVAFNAAAADLGYGAVYFKGPSANSPLTLQSTIIAKNTAGASHAEKDVYVASGHGLLAPSGADNLVMQTNILVPPPGVITVTSDPKLGPLQINGGPTRTRALLPGSPALTKGNDNITPTLTYDQRGLGYPRKTGTAANIKTDIGAVEFDSIFFDSFD